MAIRPGIVLKVVKEGTSPSAEVLDVTAFLSEHPGGKKSIMMFAGKDAAEE